MIKSVPILGITQDTFALYATYAGFVYTFRHLHRFGVAHNLASDSVRFFYEFMLRFFSNNLRYSACRNL